MSFEDMFKKAMADGLKESHRKNYEVESIMHQFADALREACGGQTKCPVSYFPKERDSLYQWRLFVVNDAVEFFRLLLVVDEQPTEGPEWKVKVNRYYAYQQIITCTGPKEFAEELANVLKSAYVLSIIDYLTRNKGINGFSL